MEGLLTYLESHGAQIQQIWFTHGLKYDRLLAAISVSKTQAFSQAQSGKKKGKKSFILRFGFQRGCCPDLELLEVNTKLDSKDGELPLCVQALQMACPKLKVEDGKYKRGRGGGAQGTSL